MTSEVGLAPVSGGGEPSWEVNLNRKGSFTISIISGESTVHRGIVALSPGWWLGTFFISPDIGNNHAN